MKGFLWSPFFLLVEGQPDTIFPSKNGSEDKKTEMKMRKLFCFFLLTVIFFSKSCFSCETKKIAVTPEQIVDTCAQDFDEFDFLIEEAFDRGISEEDLELEVPTKTQIVIRKVAEPFVCLYVYMVLKYRILQSCFAKTWRYIHSFFYKEIHDDLDS